MRSKHRRRLKALSGALSLENHEFTAERMSLARALEVLNGHARALDREKAVLSQAEARVREMLTSDESVSLEDLRTWQAYLPIIKSRLSEAEKNVARSEQFVQTSNEKVAHRNARIRAIERVNTRAQRQYGREIEKLLGKELDELWQRKRKRTDD